VSRPSHSYLRRNGKETTVGQFKEPRDPKNLHRPLSAGDDLTDVFAWREERTVSNSLTLQYDKVLILLEPNEMTRELRRKRVTVVDYPDGRLVIRYRGLDLPYTTFDKLRQVSQATIVENKHLGAVLSHIRERQIEPSGLRTCDAVRPDGTVTKHEQICVIGKIAAGSEIDVRLDANTSVIGAAASLGLCAAPCASATRPFGKAASSRATTVQAKTNRSRWIMRHSLANPPAARQRPHRTAASVGVARWTPLHLNSMGYPESQVRNGLFAGGRWIRTLGPPPPVSLPVNSGAMGEKARASRRRRADRGERDLVLGPGHDPVRYRQPRGRAQGLIDDAEPLADLCETLHRRRIGVGV
jgi:hypothetical protein